MHRNGICMADGCEEPRRRAGPRTFYCNVHYRRMHNTGRLDLKTTEERYEEKVDRSGGADACHPWTGVCSDSGYGLFSDKGKVLASRWAYRRYIGPLLEGEVVRHTCDNPPCQNRRHWLKGTQLDNIRDMMARGRQRHPGGEQHSKAKFTAKQITDIRNGLTGEYGEQARLAREYGVNSSTIFAIVAGLTWKST